MSRVAVEFKDDFIVKAEKDGVTYYKITEKVSDMQKIISTYKVVDGKKVLIRKDIQYSDELGE